MVSVSSRKVRVEGDLKNGPVSCRLLDRHRVLVIDLEQLVERTVNSFEVESLDDSIQVLESRRGVLAKREESQSRRDETRGTRRRLTRSIMLARCCSEVRCSFFAWLTVDSSLASSLQSSL